MSDNTAAPSSISQNSKQNFAKKSRGRPRGSKNRPKPTSIIEEESNIMEQILIEIPKGRDIVESLINLARSRQAGISVLCGSGFVHNVTLLHPVTRAPDISIEGPIYMISLMGNYINPNIGNTSPWILSTITSKSNFSVSLSCGDEGQVVGGIVGGKLMAAGNVLITATLVKKPEFHRLGMDN